MRLAIVKPKTLGNMDGVIIYSIYQANKCSNAWARDLSVLTPQET